MKRLFPLCAALLLGLTACTPAPSPSLTPGPATSPPPTSSGGLTVHTDWSKLGERPTPLPEVGGRWYEDYTDELLPRDDYGTLIPYAGLRLMDNWPANDGCLYGLMTTEGVAVTDPAFSSASYISYYSGNTRHGLPLLLLSKGDPSLGDVWDPSRLAVAAGDGSWVTGYEYRCCRATENGLLLFTEDSLVTMAPDGGVLFTCSPDDLGLTQEEFTSFFSDVSWGEGAGGTWCGEYISLLWADENATSVKLYQTTTGQQVTMLHSDWMDYQREQAPPVRESELTAEQEAVWDQVQKSLPPADRHNAAWREDQLLGSEAPGLLVVASIRGEETELSYYNYDAARISLLDGFGDYYGRYWYQQVNVVGGLIEVLDLNTASYYDMDTMECVFRTYLGYEGG